MRTTVGQARFGITTGSGMENRACDLREAPQHPKLSAGLEWLELEGFWILILGPAGQLIQSGENLQIEPLGNCTNK